MKTDTQWRGTFMLRSVAGLIATSLLPFAGVARAQSALDQAKDSNTAAAAARLLGATAEDAGAAAPASTTACGGVPNTKLASGQKLAPNAPITSPNGKYKLVYQTDGNLVVYTGTTSIWASNKQSTPGYAIIQTDGNFVTYDATNKATWASTTSYQHPGAWLAVQDDGNVVVYDNNSCNPLWATKSSAAPPTVVSNVAKPAATLPPIAVGGAPAGHYILHPQVSIVHPPTPGSAPPPNNCGGVPNTKLASGQKLAPNAVITSPNGHYKLVYQSDGNLVLYTGEWPQATAAVKWASNKRSTPGSAIMQADGNFVTYDAANKPTWASTTSNPHPGAWLAMQDDGNVVVYEKNGCRPLWSSK